MEHAPVIRQMYTAKAWTKIGLINSYFKTNILQVESDTGADGNGSFTMYEGVLNRGNITGRYIVYNVYGADDPSICMVFYYLANSVSNVIV